MELKKIFNITIQFFYYIKLLEVIRIFNLPNIITKHLYFNGIINIRVDSKHSFKIIHYGYQTENELYWQGLTGKYEKETLKLWIQLSKKSNLIFDIGANTGVFALTAKAVNIHSKVFAFEPIERVYKKLQYNNIINNMILPA